MMAHQGRFCAFTGLATNAIAASENIASVNALRMMIFNSQIFRSASNIRILKAGFRTEMRRDLAVRSAA